MSNETTRRLVSKHVFVATSTCMATEVCGCGCGAVRMYALDDKDVVQAVVALTPDQWRDALMAVELAERATATVQ